MAGILIPWAFAKFWDGTVPAAGYKIYFYAAGTTTKINAYSDVALTTPLANPTTLNSNGEVGAIYLSTASYKLTLALPTDTDPPAAAIRTQDNISGLGGAPTSSAYLTVGSDSTLTAERSVAAGTVGGIDIADGGANAAITWKLTPLTAFDYLGDGAGAGQPFSVAGRTKGYGFIHNQRGTYSKVIFNLSTSDASATNAYQIGIYTHAGVLVEKLASSYVPNNAATGEKTLSLATTITMDPGLYYFCTSAINADVARLAAATAIRHLTFFTHVEVSTSSMPASFTPPADSWVRDVGTSLWFALVP